MGLGRGAKFAGELVKVCAAGVPNNRPDKQVVGESRRQSGGRTDSAAGFWNKEVHPLQFMSFRRGGAPVVLFRSFCVMDLAGLDGDGAASGFGRFGFGINKAADTDIHGAN